MPLGCRLAAPLLGNWAALMSRFATWLHDGVELPCFGCSQFLVATLALVLVQWRNKSLQRLWMSDALRSGLLLRTATLASMMAQSGNMSLHRLWMRGASRSGLLHGETGLCIDFGCLVPRAVDFYYGRPHWPWWQRNRETSLHRLWLPGAPRKTSACLSRSMCEQYLGLSMPRKHIWSARWLEPLHLQIYLFTAHAPWPWWCPRLLMETRGQP